MKKILLTIFVVALLPQLATAQLDDEYFAADQLLRQQEYEKAAEKFQQLHDDHPDTYIFLDKLTECLINLKEYDQAISITQQAADRGNLRAQALIRLAEIYHTSGEQEKAFGVWNQVLEKYAGSQQIHLRVARSMKEREAFERAIEIFKKARQMSSDSNTAATELADTYLQAGQYEQAIQEYLQLVRANPQRMNSVQRRLIRFRDDYIYDVAILEISDFLDDLSPSHPSYQNLQQLEVWLLMERKLFERALVNAKNTEEESSNLTYALYNLGSKLLAEQEFALAEQAYSYYIDNNVVTLKNRCREELANVYIQWAKYLQNYNLGLSTKRDKLYQQAFETLESLRQEAPNYPRKDQVLMQLSELSLDVLHEPQKAADYLEELRKLSTDSTQMAHESYIEGRLHLYNQEYTRARISFSKSSKQERIGDLAEKNRYYLALTDFYAGDYDFAKIQLNALERQTTSYFANDAVQLRLWIQNGLQADSSGAKLDPFAKAIEQFAQGNDQLGINTLTSLLEDDRSNPLVDEALMELSTYQDPENAIFLYRVLSSYLTQQGQASPLYERLLWEKARLADQFVTNENMDPSLHAAANDTTGNHSKFFNESPTQIPTTVQQLVPIYEELLINFPNGFYSTYARDRIQELQNPQT
ncbi:MAG: tetratricopeptide repeat protein [Fodinibius sp.]|nr:tetratricopeptide repeat protein [Fodinibius sp.]